MKIIGLKSESPYQVTFIIGDNGIPDCFFISTYLFIYYLSYPIINPLLNLLVKMNRKGVVVLSMVLANTSSCFSMIIFIISTHYFRVSIYDILPHFFILLFYLNYIHLKNIFTTWPSIQLKKKKSLSSYISTISLKLNLKKIYNLNMGDEI